MDVGPFLESWHIMVYISCVFSVRTIGDPVLLVLQRLPPNPHNATIQWSCRCPLVQPVKQGSATGQYTLPAVDVNSST